MLSDHVADHASRDLVELFFEVGPLQLSKSYGYTGYLLVAVFKHKVLALLHLLNGRDLILKATHGVFGDVVGELSEAIFHGVIGILQRGVEFLCEEEEGQTR